MVYDSVNNPAAGGADTDICSHSYCCTNTNTYAHTGRADANADTRCNGYTNSYSDCYASAKSARSD